MIGKPKLWSCESPSLYELCISFEKEDVKKELIHISEYVTYVECPECGEKNIVGEIANGNIQVD